MDENKDNPVKEVGSTDSFKCPGCGNIMHFDPEQCKLICDYCNTVETFDIEYNGISENDFYNAIGNINHDWGEKRAAFTCASCGASITLGPNEVAGVCPFCGRNHILKEESFSGDICPAALIPFKITKKKASDAFSSWLRKKIFVPNALKKNHSHNEMKGVYIPSWTYDSDTYSTYRAMGGEVYYTTETYTTVENGKTTTHTRRVRHVRWFPVSGTHSEFMDDILVTASKQIDLTGLERSGSFDLKKLVKYSPEYIAGFVAERYSIDLPAGWKNAQSIIRGRIESSIRNKILKRYDEVKNISFDTKYNAITYKHILLPVWLSSFIYKEKKYDFIVNGQSGKISGKTPLSPWKVALAVLIGLVIIAGIVLIVICSEGNS